MTNKERDLHIYAAWKMLQNGLTETAEDELAAVHGMQNIRCHRNGRLIAKLVLPVNLSADDITELQAKVKTILDLHREKEPALAVEQKAQS